MQKRKRKKGARQEELRHLKDWSKRNGLLWDCAKCKFTFLGVNDRNQGYKLGTHQSETTEEETDTYTKDDYEPPMW